MFNEVGKRSIKICLFDKNSSKSDVVNTMGNEILDPICIECSVIDGIDGTGELDATFIVSDSGLHEKITQEAILKVKVDYGYEIYRIASITRQVNIITVFARQITISETLDMWCDNIYVPTAGVNWVLTRLLNDSVGNKNIEVSSNITVANTVRYVNMSMYEAIHNNNNGILSVWSGEIQRRGYRLTINDRIGEDNHVEIRSGKNLTGFEESIDISEVVTRIKAYGSDNLYANQLVDSPLINNYTSVKTAVFEYSDVRVKTNPNDPDEEGFNTAAEARAELLRRARLEFSQNKIDEPKANYIINFVYLGDTEEYKIYSIFEQVNIGDTVYVYEKSHNINVAVRVISKKYDVLNQKILEVELSNYIVKNKKGRVRYAK